MDFIILSISLLLLIRRQLAWVLFSILTLTTSYFGTGTNLANFLFVHNVSDTGLLLYLILFFYILKINNWNLKRTQLSKSVSLFYIFLLVTILIDLVINGIDISSILKTSRHWIFLSCVWIFSYIPSDETEKLIKYLLKTTAIITIIMLVDFITGSHIINKISIKEVSNSGNIFVRAAIPSTFTLFFILILFTDYFKLTKKIKYSYILLFASIIIASMIRSLFLATVLGIFMTISINERLRIKSIIVALSIVIIFFSMALSFPTIKERFFSGYEEIHTFNGNNTTQGNFSFRILHTKERINYITKNLQYTIFGIGNITEDNFPEIFHIGLIKNNEQIMQLDTGDIAWSLLLIRLGFLGTFIYLIFNYKFLAAAYRFKSSSFIATTLFVYIFTNLTMISFASSNLATGQFWLFPILTYFYITQNFSAKPNQIKKYNTLSLKI